MKTIIELSDLVGNEELTQKYFGQANASRLANTWGSTPIKNQIFENMEGRLTEYPEAIIKKVQESKIGIDNFLDILPKGVIIPVESTSGQVTIGAYENDTYSMYQYKCQTKTTIPLKNYDEIYLVFPFGIRPVSIISDSKFKMLPIWDIVVVKNRLLKGVK